MKKMIFSLSILFFSSLLQAQTVMMPVECGSLKELAEVVTEYEEKPFAVAETVRQVNGSPKTFTVLIFVNIKTGSWTIAEKISDGKYCVTSGGKNFNLIEQTKTL